METKRLFCITKRLVSMKCLNCNKELEQLKGKRKREFCNSTCRSNYWQKAQTKIRRLIKQPINPIGKFVDIDKIVEITITPKDHVKFESNNSEIEKQIAAVKDEKIPPERNTPLGRGIWNKEQQQKINKLQSQLK